MGSATYLPKGPQEVRAWQWDGTTTDAYALLAWITSNGTRARLRDGYPSQGPDTISLEAKTGPATVVPHFWVVLGPDGFFEVLQPKDFDQRYRSPLDDAEEPQEFQPVPEGVIWEPDRADSLEEVVFQAIGAGSTCWGRLNKAGVFDSTRAKWVAEGLLEHINRIMDQPRDEYHTMDELYLYRMVYNAHAVNEWARHGTYPVVKSKFHSDGKPCFDGEYFIVTATLPSGQISNHYKLEYWELFLVPEVDLPPEWDGHTPELAAERLMLELKRQAQNAAVREADVPARTARVERRTDIHGKTIPRDQPDYPEDEVYDPKRLCDHCSKKYGHVGDCNSQ